MRTQQLEVDTGSDDGAGGVRGSIGQVEKSNQ